MKNQIIKEAIERISSAVRRAESPAVFTSFGKDSMALLGLLRESGLLSKVHLVNFRHPGFHGRYKFADEIIANWQLDPLIVLHGWNAIIAGNGRVDLLGTATTRGSRIHIPVANMEWSSESRLWSCALDNQLPHGVDLIKLDFDLVLLGSKQSDHDPVVGQVRVDSFAEGHDGKTSLLFPLKEWSDEDVWDFIRNYQVPYDTKRYVNSTDGKVSDDVTYAEHSEHLPVCTACINPANSGDVWCPKFRKALPCKTSGFDYQSYPPKWSTEVPEVVAL